MSHNSQVGYGSCEPPSLPANNNNNLIDSVHEHYLNQIRQQSDNPGGPMMANFQIRALARSRRRPILRTKSESDFNAMMDQDVEKMRARLIKHYGNTHKGHYMKGMGKLTTNQKFVLISIAIVDFTSFASMSILAPFFPNEATSKGVASSVSGFVFSVYALVVFLASPLMGKIVGVVGPKFLLILGIFLCGVCNILFGLLDRVESTTTFTVYCFLVRIFEALGAAAFATAGYTFVAQIFPDNIGAVLGALETCVGLGLSVGPAIGGLLYDWGGYGLPFYSLGVLMLLTIPLNMFLLPSSRYDEVSTQKSGSMLRLFKLAPVVVVCMVVITSSNAWGFLDPTLEPHLREFDLSAKQLGLFFLLSSFLYAVSSPLWGCLADKMEATWILMGIGLIGSSCGLLLLGPSPILPLENTIWLNIVALVILGTSIAMALLPTFEAILDFAIEGGYNDDVATYGLIAGLWSSMYSLGEVIGPSLGGFLLDNFGFPVCSSVMAALCLVVGIFVLLYFSTIHTTDSVSRDNLRDKITTTSDSGIGENDNGSCSSSSSSSACSIATKRMNVKHSALIEFDEKTPLLSRSFDDQMEFSSNNFQPNYRGSFANHNYNSNPTELTESGEQREFEYSTSASFPEVLKTVSFTGCGAVEV